MKAQIVSRTKQYPGQSLYLRKTDRCPFLQNSYLFTVLLSSPQHLSDLATNGGKFDVYLSKEEFGVVGPTISGRIRLDWQDLLSLEYPDYVVPEFKEIYLAILPLTSSLKIRKFIL